MKKLFLIVLAQLATGYVWSAQVLTPQKYCESLAAVSCEVLNYEVTSASASNAGDTLPLAQIKYCRNRIFKSRQFVLVSDRTNGPNQSITAAGATIEQQLRYYNVSGVAHQFYTKMESTALCTGTTVDSASGFTTNILP